jgi:signal transduction histidine kinase
MSRTPYFNTERTLQLKIKTLPSVRGDQAMIHQVFVNLMSNAIKFTRPQETGVIEIGCIGKENQPIRLPGLKPGVCSGDSGQGSG